MTYQEALKHFGTQMRIATALGISQPTVSQWGGVIPDAYQYQLEVITGGELLVDDRLRLPATNGVSSKQSVQQSAGAAPKGQMR